MDDRASTDTETIKYWLALVRIPALGSIGVHRLLDKFGTPEAIFREAGGSAASLGLSVALESSLRNPD